MNTEFIEFISQLRQWENLNFPSSQSRILFDILIQIEKYRINGKVLSIKEVENILPYSSRGIRYAIQQLVREDWCVINTTTKDRRVKILVGTKKLKDKFLEFKSYIFTINNFSK